MEQQDRDRKPYTPPTLTNHGDAVRQTKGFGGEFWETLLPKARGSDLEDPPD